MKIYFVRHGETEWWQKDLCQGWKDSKLTEVGQRFAGRIGEELGNKKIEVIFSSDLGRCIETSEIINDSLGVKIPEVGDLRERNFGELGGLPSGRVEEKLDFSNLDEKAPGGESYNNMKKRVLGFIKKISSEKYDNVLMVSHYGPMEVVMKEFGVKNGSEVPEMVEFEV